MSTDCVRDVDRSLLLGSIEGHILLLHSVCLPQVHDQIQMIQRIGTGDSALA